MNKLLVTCSHLENELSNKQYDQIEFEIIQPKESKQTFSSEEMKSLLHGVHTAIIGDDEIDFSSIQENKTLKNIIKWGVGYDGIKIHELKNSGINIFHTPGVFSDEVSDLAIGLMISVVRGINQMDQDIRNGVWQQFKGTTFNGKTAGIIGFGAIGQGIYSRLLPFGLNVIWFDPFADTSLDGKRNFEDILLNSDYIFLACNLTPETRNIINKESISKMKNKPVLINISRGGLIEENDLMDALKNKKIKAVGLDVFESEPPINELIKHNQSVFTSHSGSSTFEAINKINKVTLELSKLLLEEKDYSHLPVRKLN
ncbi:MAG: hypothetical protein CBC72_001840 [Gammaproteobacteria bacterium TMED112]|nr:MAG: hypothetical protein CBC72_001840 [Gammaproteobacteria bacterium TMED112]|tara:strand:+ start:10280 stop:11221 length:942 start_codon:yes stop_codon:yes gene_type:complete